jgi:hypothetical protein
LKAHAPTDFVIHEVDRRRNETAHVRMSGLRALRLRR